MRPIGVLLVEERQGILSGIVRDILDADHRVALVGATADTGRVSDVVERLGAQAVVWVAPAGASPVGLLGRHPELRVLAVAGDGRRLMTTTCVELSPETLIEALCRA